MQGKACYGECYRELSIGKLGVAYGNPYYRNLGLFRGCLTEQELILRYRTNKRILPAGECLAWKEGVIRADGSSGA